MIGAVSSGNTPFVSESQSGSADAASLQRQKEFLQQQLEAVKSRPKNS